VIAVALPRGRAVRGALAALSLCALLPALGTSIANVGLPAMGRAFGASFHDVQWIVLAYLGAVTVLSPVAGRLGDLIGRRRLLLVGVSIYSVASGACGFAPSLAVLIAGRAAQGLGAAIMMALGLSFVGDSVPIERTGSVMGLLGTMSSVGTALGPSLGGTLVAQLGWRAVFFAGVPLGAAALALAYRFLPTTMPVFAPPVMGAGVLSNKELRTGLALSSLVSAVVMAAVVVGPFYLGGALGLDAARMGLVMSAGPLVAALTGFPAGRFVDRLGARRLTLTGLSTMLIGTSAMALSSAESGVAGYVLPLVVITSGYALFQAANNTSVMSGTRAGQRGAASGALAFSRNLGLVTGASLMGAAFAFGSGAANALHATPDALAAGLRMTFTLATTLVAVSLILSLNLTASPLINQELLP
jgi:MFS family permease